MTSSGIGVDIVRHSVERFKAAHGFYVGPGVTSASTGARNFGLRRGQSYPGEIGIPHFHPFSQTANFMIAGHAVVYFGPDLSESLIVNPGDFVYFDSNVIHQPINPNPNEPFEFLQLRDTDTDPLDDFVIADVVARDIAAAQARFDAER